MPPLHFLYYISDGKFCPWYNLDVLELHLKTSISVTLNFHYILETKDWAYTTPHVFNYSSYQLQFTLHVSPEYFRGQ